jgi:hypothetical protein
VSVVLLLAGRNAVDIWKSLSNVLKPELETRRVLLLEPMDHVGKIRPIRKITPRTTRRARAPHLFARKDEALNALGKNSPKPGCDRESLFILG